MFSQAERVRDFVTGSDFYQEQDPNADFEERGSLIKPRSTHLFL